MEFEKLREIIADVMNIDEKEIKEDSSFVKRSGCGLAGCIFRLSWALKTLLILR